MRRLQYDAVMAQCRAIIRKTIRFALNKFALFVAMVSDKYPGLDLVPPGNLLDASISQQINWLTMVSGSFTMASTTEEMKRRLVLMIEVIKKHGIHPSDLHSPSTTALVSAAVKQLLPEPERQAINDANAALLSMWHLDKSKLFVLDPELIGNILQANIPECDHPMLFPYPSVWVESSKSVDNPADAGEHLAGFQMTRAPTEEQFKDAVDRFKDHAPYSLLEDVSISPSEYHMLYSWEKKMGKMMQQFEYFQLKNCMGYGPNGVVLNDNQFIDRGLTVSHMTARILSYLSSANIEYTLVRREREGSSKKKYQCPRPYYVTEMKKNYVHGISHRTGIGSKLTYQVEVRGHIFHRWYCPNCNRTYAIERFLKGEVCKECGEIFAKEKAVIRSYWRPPHKRGPDVAQQALRHFYRGRDDKSA